jgi:TolA-binding protein
MAKTQKKGLEEIIESPEALAQELGKAQTFAEKNKNLLLGVLAGVVVLIGGYFFWNYYTATQDEEAQDKLYTATTAFEQDSTKKSLKEAVKVADDFGSTKAGNLAHFVAGVSALREGKYDDAIDHLKDFSASDLLMQARAYALIGDAYMEKKSYGDAANYYQKAADYKPNKFYTPGYLVKLATAYEEDKKTKDAIEVYDEIIEKYEDTPEFATAKKYKAKLEGLTSE